MCEIKLYRIILIQKITTANTVHIWYVPTDPSNHQTTIKDRHANAHCRKVRFTIEHLH